MAKKRRRGNTTNYDVISNKHAPSSLHPLFNTIFGDPIEEAFPCCIYSMMHRMFCFKRGKWDTNYPTKKSFLLINIMYFSIIQIINGNSVVSRHFMYYI